jgi:ATP-dependent helicase/nuclease subunit A
MAAERIVLPDSQVRRRAATDFETNLVVLAGAGTGKTSLLVERALNAIGSGVATMESIAAITFTEKAAGEMRERLAVGLNRLRMLAREGGSRDAAQEADRAFDYLTGTLEVSKQELAARALGAMEQLDHGTVMTIHGFCAEVLRAHPVESGVDPGFLVDSGEWAESVGRELWAEFVRRELGPDGTDEETWARLLSWTSLSELETTARELAGFGVPADLLAPAGSGDALDLLKLEALWIVREIDSLLDRSDDWSNLGHECLSGFRTALDALAQDGLEACRQSLESDPQLAQRLDSGGLGSAKKNAGEDAAREFKRVTGQARALWRGVLRTNDEQVGEMIRVLEPFAREFRETYLARGLGSGSACCSWTSFRTPTPCSTRSCCFWPSVRTTTPATRSRRVWNRAGCSSWATPSNRSIASAVRTSRPTRVR